MDIQDFKKKLKLEFSGKGNLSDYETYQIPAAKKKNLGVNGAAIKNDKKDDDKPDVYKEFIKERIPIEEDNKIKKNLRTLAETKVNLDTTLKDKEVWRDTDIAELVKKEKHNSCYCCASPNCLIKQRICIKYFNCLIKQRICIKTIC